MKYMVVVLSEFDINDTFPYATSLTRRVQSFIDTVIYYEKIEDVEKYIMDNKTKTHRIFEIAKELKFSHKFNWE